MPLRKLRSIDEAAPPTRLRRLDPDNFRRALALSKIAFRLHPWRLVPGVHKRPAPERRSVTSRP